MILPPQRQHLRGDASILVAHGGGQHQPEVHVRGVLTKKSVCICRKAAQFLIGVGPHRVQRVLSGHADGRTKGMRLPNDGVSLTSSPMAVCLRFLWRKYHFDAEGLPDRFSIHWHDATSLTIGPHQTLVPARSASSALDLDGDEVQEEEARAIAGLALYIASAHEPNSMVSLGPGAHGGPCPIHRGHEAHPPVLRNGGLVRCAGYP